MAVQLEPEKIYKLKYNGMTFAVKVMTDEEVLDEKTLHILIEPPIELVVNGNTIGNTPAPATCIGDKVKMFPKNRIFLKVVSKWFKSFYTPEELASWKKYYNSINTTS